jgi:hypothetical protein
MDNDNYLNNNNQSFNRIDRIDRINNELLNINLNLIKIKMNKTNNN